jgi:alkaline phosphatase D
VEQAKVWQVPELEGLCRSGDITACAVAGQPARIEERLRLPLLQAVSNRNRALFSILEPRADAISWFVRWQRSPSEVELLPLVNVDQNAPEGSPWRVRVVTVELPVAAQSQPLILVGLGAQGQLRDLRRFQAMPAAEPARELRWALVSCMDDAFANEGGPMWTQLMARSPEVILAIGDNVYADWRGGKKIGEMVDPATLWDRFVEARFNLSIYRSEALIPWASVWDDHDYGMNDGDRTYPHREASTRNFRLFFPTGLAAETQAESQVRQGPGTSSVINVAGQTFLLLDGRSFRSPNGVPPICKQKPDSRPCRNKKDPPVGDETHFGAEQTDWALAQVRAAPGPVWLVAGTQWYGGYQPFESFEGNHPQDFVRFRQRLNEAVRRASGQPARPIAFASGDRHLSEVMRIKVKDDGLPFDTVELTSSAIHAKVFPSNWTEFPNRRQIQGAAETMNYTIVTSAPESLSQLGIRWQAFGPNNRELYVGETKVVTVTERPRQRMRSRGSQSSAQ